MAAELIERRAGHSSRAVTPESVVARRRGRGTTSEDREPLVELESGTARDSFGENDLPLGTTLEFGPGDIVASIVA